MSESDTNGAPSEPLTAEQMGQKALAFEDRDHEFTTAFGMKVWVWQMPLENRDKFDLWNAESRQKEDITAFRTRLVVETCCDEQGNPIFKLDDMPALAKKGHTIHRLSKMALRINKMRTQDLEDEEKNSESATAGSSPSG
jgi:hypothetical protein